MDLPDNYFWKHYQSLNPTFIILKIIRIKIRFLERLWEDKPFSQGIA